MSNFFYSKTFTGLLSDINTLKLSDNQDIRITNINMYDDYYTEIIQGKGVI